MRAVSKSGFYAWSIRQKTVEEGALALETTARAAHEKECRTYGSKRLQSTLAETGLTMGISFVKRSGTRLGLRYKQERNYKDTTDSQHELPIALNLLQDLA